MKRFMAISVVVTFTFALERLTKQQNIPGLVVDETVSVDLSGQYYNSLLHTRMLGRVEFTKRITKAIPVAEVREKCKVSEDEWMYKEGASGNPYHLWDKCVEAAVAGDWSGAQDVCVQAMDKMDKTQSSDSWQWLPTMLERKSAVTSIVFH
eukprot:gene57460-biopygen85151